ncbi:MAG: hypothetical protein HYU36_08420 [Planctomycetes bacterium]|nr:hypothetical protein [Planctomycetota bacterium]
MTDEIQRVEYRQGMIETRTQADALPVRVWSGAGMPEEIREAIRTERLTELGGVYGDREAGDPIQYDHLTLESQGGVVKIEVFNRAILLFLGDDERIRQIHRVLCKLDKGAATTA